MKGPASRYKLPREQEHDKGRLEQSHSRAVSCTPSLWPYESWSVSGSTAWHAVLQRLERLGDNIPPGNEEL